MQDLNLIKDARQRIIEKYGPWTAHNIHLGGDVYTIGNQVVGDELKLKRFLQILVDMVKKPLNELRILDLACLEGLYAIELARHGAKVVGIEGRDINLAKAKFVKDVLNLDNLELALDDVRNLSVDKYGKFDVVFCFGILYHLPAPDVFAFLEQIAATCTNMALIDTHISMRPWQKRSYNDNIYSGRSFLEHPPTKSKAKRLQALWSSLDNTTSFWLTKASLHNFLLRAGFTTTYENVLPSQKNPRHNRPVVVALKGSTIKIISAPQVDNTKPVELDE